LVKQRENWLVVLNHGRRTAGEAIRRYCWYTGKDKDKAICNDDVHSFCPSGCEMTIAELFDPRDCPRGAL
jgi:hypothetical protein